MKTHTEKQAAKLIKLANEGDTIHLGPKQRLKTEKRGKCASECGDPRGVERCANKKEKYKVPVKKKGEQKKRPPTALEFRTVEEGAEVTTVDSNDERREEEAGGGWRLPGNFAFFVCSSFCFFRWRE